MKARHYVLGFLSCWLGIACQEGSASEANLGPEGGAEEHIFTEGLIKARSMDAPHSQNLSLFTLPVQAFLPEQTLATDNIFLECSENAFHYRMGNHHLAVWNFDRTLDGHPHALCAGESWPVFADSGADNSRFRAQNQYAKTMQFLQVLSPLMDGKWQYHPSLAASSEHFSTPAPLMLWLDHPDRCHGFSGIFHQRKRCDVDTDEWFLNYDAPYADLVSTENCTWIDTIQVCNAEKYNEATLFHELGHYLDAHLSYGTLGANGPSYDRCCLDTAAESHALKETIAQLVMIYAQKKLYPLSYTLKGFHECRFYALGSHLRADIVHQDCRPSPYNAKIYSFAETRPSTDDQKTGCNPATGYRVQAWFQAFWQLLFGQMCTEDLTCTPIAADLPPNYEDRYMEALIYALEQGNTQSYIEFWSAMGRYIKNHYSPTDYDLFLAVTNLHKIEPAPFDENCSCPKVEKTGIPPLTPIQTGFTCGDSNPL